MAVHNASIAETLRHVADLLEIEGANPFRIRAYRRAAQTVEDLPQSAAKMVADGKTLVGLPGIGKDLAGRITEICATGTAAFHQELLRDFPATLLDILRLQGVGPKTAALLYQTLHISTLDALEEAVAVVPGVKALNVPPLRATSRSISPLRKSWATGPRWRVPGWSLKATIYVE